MANTAKNSHPKRNLRHILKDGFWNSASQGFVESNFSAFAVFLQASPFEIGILGSGPLVLASFLQLWTGRFQKLFGGPKGAVLAIQILQATLFLLMACCTLLQLPLQIFLFGAIGLTALIEFQLPMWSSWVSVFIPPQKRGFFFARRNKINHLTVFFAMLLGGLWLDQTYVQFSKNHLFACVFLLGAGFKLCSFFYLLHQNDLPILEKSEVASRSTSLRHLPYKDAQFRKIMVFYGLMGFAVNISGPFNTAYALKELKLDYLHFSVLFGLIAIARSFSTVFWGRVLDKAGSLKLLVFASFLMPFLPLGWCVIRSYEGLALFQLFSGAVWAAYDLASFTFLIDCSSSKDRTQVFSAKQILWSMGSFSGALLGSYVLSSEFTWFYADPRIVFWASLAARALAAFAVLQVALESLPRAHLNTSEPTESLESAA